VLVEHHAYAFSGSTLNVTVSLGLAQLQADDSLQSLIARADRALYHAKQSGRNRVSDDIAQLA
jgi:diguanylate cyclase (GGDEF)-like protein